MASTATGHTLPAPFEHYELDDAHDEMIDPAGSVRPQYEHMYQALQNLQHAGLLRIDYGAVLVDDLDGLRKYSG